MPLPAEALQRWGLAEGGLVEVADLGGSLLIVPASSSGLRAMLLEAVDEAGGYPGLAEQAAREEPDLT